MAGSAPHIHLARWRRGNAVVCKTTMRGFESLPCLAKCMCGIAICHQNFYTTLEILDKSGTKPLFAGANPAVAFITATSGWCNRQPRGTPRTNFAEVAELAYAVGLKPTVRKDLWVQIPPSASAKSSGASKIPCSKERASLILAPGILSTSPPKFCLDKI